MNRMTEKEDLEYQRNKKINEERGEAINRIQASTDWAYIQDIKKDLLEDLSNAVFMRAQAGVDLVLEPTYGQIVSYRNGVIDGVNKFFDLLGKLESVYLESRRQDKENK
jgi:hypothetical protein